MNLKIRKIRKESSSVVSNKATEKTRVNNKKITKEVKPKQEDRIYKTNVDIGEPFGMNDILVYFYEKYEGNWDAIYNAILEKEPVDKKKCKEFLKPYKEKYDYTTLLDEKYPRHLKEEYKPPFVLKKRKKFDD